MVTSTSSIPIESTLKGMWVSGYMTMTDTDEGLVCYGAFPSLDEAKDWAKKLDNAKIIPVYYPSYNRG